MKFAVLILYNLPFGKEWNDTNYGELDYEKNYATIPTELCTGWMLLYNKVIVDWIYSRTDLFDSTKTFIEGFSKNGASGSKLYL